LLVPFEVSSLHLNWFDYRTSSGYDSSGSFLEPLGVVMFCKESLTSGSRTAIEKSQTAHLPDAVLLLFAVAAGISVANIYCAQPLLDAMAQGFGFNRSSAGAVILVTQIGYAMGLLFIVPLGDLLNRRRLVLTQLSLSAILLALVGLAHSEVLLFTGLFFVGLLAVVVQVLVAFAGSLAPLEKRGRAVGTVTSGVVIGILLARVVAGALSDLGGWRAVYLLSSLLTVALAAALFRVVPNSSSEMRSSYAQLLRSTFGLYRTTPILRVRAAIALLLFAAFSTLWTSLVLPLSEPPHPFSRTAIGLFGMAGAGGAVAAGRAGHLADQGRGQWTTGIGLGLLLISWAGIACLHRSLLALVIGIAFLDFAVQAVHVTNQSMIFAARPEAKSRLVGTYMVFYSIGSGIGALAATRTYAAFHWTGVCLLGASFSMAALGIWAFTTSISRP
jgi:predicted MFS family arabinose efflux permease